MAAPARLTSALLARKGQALPTGGFAHAKLALIPPQPAAAKRNRQRCDTLSSSGSAAARPPARQRAAVAGDRVAFTVRLDRERHGRLKILAARRGAVLPGDAAQGTGRLPRGVRHGLPLSALRRRLDVDAPGGTMSRLPERCERAPDLPGAPRPR